MTAEAARLAAWRVGCATGWIAAGRSSIDRPARRGPLTPATSPFSFAAMTDVWHYETALADAGFDYLTVGGSAFYAQQEVRTW